MFSPFAAGHDHRRCFMPGCGMGGVSKYLRLYFNDYDYGGHVLMEKASSVSCLPLEFMTFTS